MKMQHTSQNKHRFPLNERLTRSGGYADYLTGTTADRLTELFLMPVGDYLRLGADSTPDDILPYDYWQNMLEEFTIRHINTEPDPPATFGEMCLTVWNEIRSLEYDDKKLKPGIIIAFLMPLINAGPEFRLLNIDLRDYFTFFDSRCSDKSRAFDSAASDFYKIYSAHHTMSKVISLWMRGLCDKYDTPKGHDMLCSAEKLLTENVLVPFAMLQEDTVNADNDKRKDTI
jgi:hypothetical protein